MRKCIPCLLVLLTVAGTAAADPEIEWLPLWPDMTSTPVETVENRSIEQNAEGYNRAFSDVTNPGITVHLPGGAPARRPAVVVLPGGGFMRLAIDKEGFDVAKRLTTAGFAVIVVKYRTWTPSAEVRAQMSMYYGASPEERADMERPGLEARAIAVGQAFADVQRAVRLARSRADEWSIDPDMIGVMGFSAGGYLAAALAMDHDSGDQEDSETVGRMSSRPDFAALIYGALDEDRMTDQAVGTMPPLFIVHAADDPLVPVDNTGMKVYQAARHNGVPVELHVFAEGGHGFGLGVKGGPVAVWSENFIQWLDDLNSSK